MSSQSSKHSDVKTDSKTTTTKTNTTTVSSITAANTGTVADDAYATLFAPGICH